MDYMDLLIPGVNHADWFMTEACKLGLTGLVASQRPKLAIQVGIHNGGSTILLSKYAKKVIAIDPDPDVVHRFRKPPNVDIIIGDIMSMLNLVLDDIAKFNKPLDLILLDFNPFTESTAEYINRLLSIVPSGHLVLLMHNTANPLCRAGVLAADWHTSPYVHAINVDLVPGTIVEHSVPSGSPECWGGLGLAILSPERRAMDVVVNQGSYTSIKLLHRAIENGSWRT